MTKTSSNTPKKRSTQQTTQKKGGKRTPSSTKKITTPKKWLKRLLLSLLGLATVATLVVIGIVAFYISSAPKLTQEALIGTMPSTIYDKNDNVIYKLGGNDRVLIDPSSIPKNIEDAVLSIEDRRFYDHHGIDIVRIGGSLLANVTRGKLQGGSTITQQLVKLSVFSTSAKDQTIKRKIQEIWLARGVESDYTKRDILALYLNKVFLANNTYGFGTAARYYFNKTPEQLTIAQAALFAGMVQAPSTYNPIANPENATNRRNVVLHAMLTNNKITQEQYDAAIATPITDGLVDRSKDKSSTELALDAYIQVVADEIKQKTNLDPYTQGLHIYTTLDFDAQKKLTDILDSNNYINWRNSNIQAAVTVLNPNDGAIVAMSGGRNTAVLLGTNRATLAHRSVGSTSKPLIDYGPAIEYLNYSTGHIILDAPIKYTNGPSLNNYDRSYFGNMTMRQALIQSRNTTALRVFKEVGTTNARAFLAKNGIVKDVLHEANAIGFEASTLQMSAAYAAFANGGYHFQPYTIRKVATQSGDVQTYQNTGERSMSAHTAYMITDILKGIPGFTAPNAAAPNLYQAGKTGSTNYTDDQLKTVARNAPFAAMDGWYVGFTRDYVIASWVGYDKPLEPGNFVTYEQYLFPQSIYKHLIMHLSGRMNKNWEKPDNVLHSGTELYIKGSKHVPVVTTTTTQSETTEETSADETSESTTNTAKTETVTKQSQQTTSQKKSQTTKQTQSSTTKQPTQPSTSSSRR